MRICLLALFVQHSSSFFFVDHQASFAQMDSLSRSLTDVWLVEYSNLGFRWSIRRLLPIVPSPWVWFLNTFLESTQYSIVGTPNWIVPNARITSFQAFDNCLFITKRNGHSRRTYARKVSHLLPPEQYWTCSLNGSLVYAIGPERVNARMNKGLPGILCSADCLEVAHKG